MINFKTEKGITIYALIITIVILVLIAGTATYTGIDVYKEAKEDAFIQQLQYVQNAVNNETNKIELGLKNYGDYIPSAEHIDNDAYVTYSPDELKNYFGLQGLTQNFKINLITKEVKTVNPLKVEGIDKYSLNDFGLVNQVIKIEDNVLISRYIKDTLLLHLDGINNTGTGNRNTTEKVWKNLVEGGQNPTYKEKPELNPDAVIENVWTDNAFVAYGIEGFALELPEFYKNGTGTIEILYEPKVSTDTRRGLIGKYQGGYPGWGFAFEASNTNIAFHWFYSYDGTQSNCDENDLGTYRDVENMFVGKKYYVASITDYSENNSTFTGIINGKKRISFFKENKKIVYVYNPYNRATYLFEVGKVDRTV